MTRRRRIALALSIAALAVVGPAVMLGLRASGASSALAARAEGALANRLGGTFSADTVEVRGLGELILRGVRHSTPVAGGRVELSADEAVLEPRLLSLLGERPSLRRLRLVGARLEVISATPAAQRPPAPPKPPPDAPRPPAPAPPPPPPPRTDDGIEVALEEVIISGAMLVFGGGAEGSEIHLDGLDLELRGVGLRDAELPLGGRVADRLFASGRFSVSSAMLPVGRVDDVSGTVEIGDGWATLSDIQASPRLGAVLATAKLDLRRVPLRHEIEVHVDRLALGDLASASEGERFATASLDVLATAIGTDAKALKGTGQVQVEGGALPGFPVLSRIESSFRRLSLRDAPHSPVVATFELADARLVFEPFLVLADDYEIAVEGSIGLDGTLDVAVVVEADRDRVDLSGLPAPVIRALLSSPDRLRLPAHVSGTAATPVVRPDADALVASASTAGRVSDERQLRHWIAQAFGPS